MLVDARDDLLAFSSFPFEHWRKIWSTSALERLHREVKRRTDGVSVFPNDASIDRLVTAVIVEQLDEWAVADAATSRRRLWPGCVRRQRNSQHRHEHAGASPADTGIRFT